MSWRKRFKKKLKRVRRKVRKVVKRLPKTLKKVAPLVGGLVGAGIGLPVLGGIMSKLGGLTGKASGFLEKVPVVGSLFKLGGKIRDGIGLGQSKAPTTPDEMVGQTILRHEGTRPGVRRLIRRVSLFTKLTT